MILYPTETVYALGVRALDEAELRRLFRTKQRPEEKKVSWLVRDIADIERYAVVGKKAMIIAERWLPGPLTLVLPARDEVSRRLTALDGTLSFRISSDLVAQKLIMEYMAEYNSPLTCTSANIGNLPTLPTSTEILLQFGDSAKEIGRVIDDGVREGETSTIVRVMGEEVTIIRPGPIDPIQLLNC
ncbi:threonylcarbamoyl-AMP synthase [Candidatus Nomurabacteria bacterium]|nr:threonylcarbamoyl-AMP synthase [Candidatus Kaiserbacteria bacterium]MCB9814827.1 threonylcarbamoyl-AMP synthase [Candidatus Nomurabacteria bacterium]